MRAGKLDRFITIQRMTSSQSDSGAVIETWSDLVARRPASYAPVRGEERVAVGTQVAASAQVDFRIRYFVDVADLGPLDRVIYPAPSADSPGDFTSSEVYDILAVQEIGRRKELQIIAVRRPDIQP
jgi:head-tail adaptor